MSLTPQPIRGMSIDPTNPLARGLAGYWPMLEGTGGKLRDYSPWGKHATKDDASADDMGWAPGQYGSAAVFSNCDMSAGLMPHIIGAPGLTVATWVKFDDTTGGSPGEGLIACWREGSNQFVLWQDQGPNGVVRFRPYNHTGATGTSSSWVPDTNWHFVVGWWDGANVRLYVDGVQIGADAALTGTLRTASHRITIGRYEEYNPGSSDLEGQMQNAAIWTRGLAETEIWQLYSDRWAIFRRKVVIPKEEPPPEPSDVIVVKQRVQPIRGMSIDKTNPLARGLVGYWPMLEGTGSTLHDYSGYGNNGTLAGDPPREWPDGKPSVVFEGAESGELAAGVLAGATEFTVSFLASNNNAGSGPVDMLIENTVNLNNNIGAWFVYLKSDGIGQMYFQRRSASGWNGCHVPFSKNQLRHVVATFSEVSESSLSQRVWIDGEEVSPTTTHSASTLGTQVPYEPTYMGARAGNANYAVASLANLAVYRRILSTSEIATLYVDPWTLFRRKVVIPAEQPPAYDIQGSNAYGSDQISFNWTVNPA